jgi:hypothetical protein
MRAERAYQFCIYAVRHLVLSTLRVDWPLREGTPRTRIKIMKIHPPGAAARRRDERLRAEY